MSIEYELGLKLLRHSPTQHGGKKEEVMSIAYAEGLTLAALSAMILVILQSETPTTPFQCA
jgi:hypothetical protein